MAHMRELYPQSQGELIRRVRGEKSQEEFAKELGVNRTSISRYESEKLGAPTKVLNQCLRAIAAQAQGGEQERPVEKALVHARQAVELLEQVALAHDRT